MEWVRTRGGWQWCVDVVVFPVAGGGTDHPVSAGDVPP